MNELEQRLAEIGQRLTGRSIIVRLKTPSRKGLRGEYMRYGNTAYVTIEPDQPPFWLLDTYCHELGHTLAHFDELAPVTLERLAAPAKSLPERRLDLVPVEYLERESEAERLGDHWLRIATRQRIAGYSLLESGLAALSRYADGFR